MNFERKGEEERKKKNKTERKKERREKSEGWNFSRLCARHDLIFSLRDSTVFLNVKCFFFFFFSARREILERFIRRVYASPPSMARRKRNSISLFRWNVLDAQTRSTNWNLIRAAEKIDSDASMVYTSRHMNRSFF